MSFWVYKCNDNPSAENSHLPSGNWDHVFAADKAIKWGGTYNIPRLVERLDAGDLVIAYQTDRKELVGLAEVVELRPHREHKEIVLRPVEEIRADFAALKRLDASISRLPCFKKGNISTIYPITTVEAWRLISLAKVQAEMQRQLKRTI